jgi:homoserine dehydrogenase
MTHIVQTALIGLGNVGRSFLKILEMKNVRLREQYGMAFAIVCVADSSGVAVDRAGFAPAELRRHKEAGGRVADLPGYLPGVSSSAIIDTLDCELVLEASPVDLTDGEPGLSVTRKALRRGVNVVLANKGPLVLAFHELHELAATHQAGLAFSATVCGALPVINIGRRDLIAADVSLLQGIFNSTTNFILAEMAEGRAYADALAEAQARGIAEADPTLDVEGWDTANKLTIIANSFLGVEIALDDVTVVGITDLTPDLLREAHSAGQRIKLIATAQLIDDDYLFSVAPAAVPRDSFLGRCDGWEMGVEIHSDLYGKMYHKLWEREPLPTAAAMLRDAVNLIAD